MAKYIVTIAPPTPNGDLHLGHISGPFLAADVFARVRRVRNDDVIFVCYSDDYQDYVARKAMQHNANKFEWATNFAHRIEDTLKRTDIQLDWFMKAYNNPYFKEAVKFFYDHANSKGVVRKKTTEVPYSTVDKVYGYEAFARGTCNYCGEESDPSQCEACANSPVLEKMGTLTSILSQQPFTFVEKEREFIALSKYAQFLKTHYSNAPIRKELADFVDHVIANAELDWFIDRPGSNGIDIEANGEEKIIHTWFSGVAGYYAATKEYLHHIGMPSAHNDYWMSKDTRIVNFLGFDCSFSHAIVYPSLLSNVDGLTTNVTPITNRFLKLEGSDFSTSRGHAIWVNDILKEVSPDALRYYLAIISPEEVVKNFEKAKFTQWNETFFNPSVATLTRYMEEKFQLSDIKLSSVCYHQVKAYKDQWNCYSDLQEFSMSKLAITLQEFLTFIVKQIEEGNTTDVNAMIQLYLVMGKPIHPSLSEKLLSGYSIPEKSVSDWVLQQTLATA